MSEAKAAYYPVSLRPGADLDEQLATRGNSAGATMKRDLLRYYRMCTRELERVSLTVREVMVLLELKARNLIYDSDGSPVATLWAVVDEGMANGLAPTAASIDGSVLVQKLRSLSPGGVLALVDALERFMLDPRRDGAKARIQVMYDVGLVKDGNDDYSRKRS